MNPLKTLLFASPFATLLFLGGCKTEPDNTYLITENSIGKLERTSLVRDLNVIFVNDSVVKDTTSVNLSSNAKKIKIFEDDGRLLLTITPSTDSIPTIENVRIEDGRFKTEKGVGLASTFKDIKDNYTINKVVNSMNNVVIFLKDSNIYFTIDRDQLPESLRYGNTRNIEPVQIPDDAKIKYMMIGWE